MSGDDLASRLKAHVSRPLPKRFYREVAVTGASPPYGIALDGKPLRTPLKAPLALPTRPLAEAVAAEWRAREDTIDPRVMHLTRLANTAIDRVEGHRPRIVDEIVAYAGSDLLCYRAEEPPGLVARQAAIWDPLIAWAESVLGARLLLVAGIVHRLQPQSVLDSLARRLETKDAFALTALHNMTTLTGSVFLACAVETGRLSARDAWAAAHVDEDWQVEQWGRDVEADARREERWQEFRSAAEFLLLADPDRGATSRS